MSSSNEKNKIVFNSNINVEVLLNELKQLKDDSILSSDNLGITMAIGMTDSYGKQYIHANNKQEYCAYLIRVYKTFCTEVFSGNDITMNKYIPYSLLIVCCVPKNDPNKKYTEIKKFLLNTIYNYTKKYTDIQQLIKNVISPEHLDGFIDAFIKIFKAEVTIPIVDFNGNRSDGIKAVSKHIIDCTDIIYKRQNIYFTKPFNDLVNDPNLNILDLFTKFDNYNNDPRNKSIGSIADDMKKYISPYFKVRLLKHIILRIRSAENNGESKDEEPRRPIEPIHRNEPNVHGSAADAAAASVREQQRMNVQPPRPHLREQERVHIQPPPPPHRVRDPVNEPLVSSQSIEDAVRHCLVP